MRDKLQITNFAKQFTPGLNKAFVEIFVKASKNPYTYLLLDNNQRLPTSFVFYQIIYKKTEILFVCATQGLNMTSQETNTPLDKSTMTKNQNNQLERPNPFAVGELGFHYYLSKPEINKTGPVLLKKEKHFCKNYCSGASPDAVHFALKRLTDIICFQKYLKLNAI